MMCKRVNKWFYEQDILYFTNTRRHVRAWPGGNQDRMRTRNWIYNLIIIIFNRTKSGLHDLKVVILAWKTKNVLGSRIHSKARKLGSKWTQAERRWKAVLHVGSAKSFLHLCHLNLCWVHHQMAQGKTSS